MTEEQLILMQQKLEKAKKAIHEIERTNDKSRRLEWREMSKFVKWAERQVASHQRNK